MRASCETRCAPARAGNRGLTKQNHFGGKKMEEQEVWLMQVVKHHCERWIAEAETWHWATRAYGKALIGCMWALCHITEQVLVLMGAKVDTE